MLDFNGLNKYADFSIIKRAVQRIIDGYPRRLSKKGFMTYQEFIPFIISEEDKKSDTAVEYWFRVLDLDGDGIISASKWTTSSTSRPKGFHKLPTSQYNSTISSAN